ncbi:hypothetical protein SEA_NICOLE72_58 [Microbacterium phage Nicole72]|uniref:Uncharacterized protein n=1 Tax=Microbacterium phage Nicole72 TaxID=3062838 RepID=A0ACD4UJZ7_9CAUD|nr:hypothetical protein SEA_NICOLE72_58 [Microbacterium phage Nicole72]
MDITPDALTLERRTDSHDETAVLTSDAPADAPGGPTVVMLTPPINSDYWAYRVRVADGQAVVGFGKFGTIGIGFAEEEDWNTNLPYTSDAESIRRHIWHNRGEGIEDTPEGAAVVVRAIELIQDAVKADRG